MSPSRSATGAFGQFDAALPWRSEQDSVIPQAHFAARYPLAQPMCQGASRRNLALRDVLRYWLPADANTASRKRADAYASSERASSTSSLSIASFGSQRTA